MNLIKFKYRYNDSIATEDDIVPENQETLEDGSYRAITVYLIINLYLFYVI
jgi:hypothetical protein